MITIPGVVIEQNEKVSKILKEFYQKLLFLKVKNTSLSLKSMGNCDDLCDDPLLEDYDCDGEYFIPYYSIGLSTSTCVSIRLSENIESSKDYILDLLNEDCSDAEETPRLYIRDNCVHISQGRAQYYVHCEI